MIEYDVFISHNGTDKPVVRELVSKLRAYDSKLRIWLDEERIVPGDSWQEKLEEGIEHSRSAVVLVGKNGLGPWEKSEIKALLQDAVAKNKRIIPVLLPGKYDDPKLPIFLREFHYVTFKEGLDSDGIRSLVKGIVINKATYQTVEHYGKSDNQVLSAKNPVEPIQQATGIIEKLPGAGKFNDPISQDIEGKNDFQNTLVAIHQKLKAIFKWVVIPVFTLIVCLILIGLSLKGKKPDNPKKNQPVDRVQNKLNNVDMREDHIIGHPPNARIFITVDGKDERLCDKPCTVLASYGTPISWRAELEGYKPDKGWFEMGEKNHRPYKLEPED